MFYYFFEARSGLLNRKKEETGIFEHKKQQNSNFQYNENFILEI